MYRIIAAACIASGLASYVFADPVAEPAHPAMVETGTTSAAPPKVM